MFAPPPSRTAVVDLPSAGVPADHGLASLGLLMQLAGRTTGALAALLASTALLDLPHLPHAAWFWFTIAMCFGRSQLHGSAGRDLTYGRHTAEGMTADPFAAMRTYVVFGVGHAIVLGLVAVLVFDASRWSGVGLTAALALWPAVLAIVLGARRFQPFRTGIPLGEDRGLEGAAIVMTVLAAHGMLLAGSNVEMLGALSAQRLEHGWGVMLVVVFALLVVRSSLHLRAGLAGLREHSFDHPGELAARYAAFGVISAFCVGGVLCLLAMSEQLTPEAIAGIAVMCWLLVIWPMVVKRYFSHRQFAELLAGDRVIHRRAPDAGLTGLGWLLAGHATLVAALQIAQLTMSSAGAGHDDLLMIGGLEIGRWWSAGPWLDLARLALEAVAAVALIRMSDHRRIIATIYAVFAGSVALVPALPVVRSLGQHLELWQGTQLMPVAAQLVLPVAVLVLARRVIAPVARARYRTSTVDLPRYAAPAQYDSRRPTTEP